MKNLLHTFIALCIVSLSFGQKWTTTAPGNWSDATKWSNPGTSADTYPGESAASLSEEISIEHDMTYNLSNGYPTYASADEFTGPINVNANLAVNFGSQLYISGSNALTIANGSTITVNGGIVVLDNLGSLGNMDFVVSNGTLAMTGSTNVGSGNVSFTFNGKFEIIGETPGGQLFLGANMTFGQFTTWTEDDSYFGTVVPTGTITFEEGASMYQSQNTFYFYSSTPIFQTGFSSLSGWRHMSSPVTSNLNVITNLPIVTSNNNAANVYRWDATPNASDTAAGFVRVVNGGDFLGPNDPALIYLTPGISGSYQPTGTVQVSGQPYNSSLGVSLHYSHDPTGNGTNTDRGWNLISNPYPCNLDLQALSNGWNLTYSAIHIWDVSSNQYRAYLNGATQIGHSNSLTSSTSQQFIRPFQAFWVKMESGDGATVSKTITPSMRDKGIFAGDYFKTEDEEEAKLRLFIHSSDTGSNAKTDEALVYFNMNSSERFEPSYDVIKKFSDVYGIPSLYMKKYDENNDATPIAIYSNAFEEDSKVPVYFRSGVADTYTLSFSEEGGFAKDVVVIDHKLNTRTLYTGQEISFDYDPTDNDHRFTLEFSRKSDNGSSADAGLTAGEAGTTSVEDLENESGLLNNTFVQGEELIVAFNLVETSGEELIVEVVDLTGRTVFSQKVNGSENLRIPTNEFLYSKFLLVTVSQADGSDKESRKVVLW